MALFPVSSNAVQIQTATPTSSDQFSNGVRLKSDGSAVFVATFGGDEVSNGLLLDANGAIICIDATLGMPAGVQYVNGLPITSSGALCISANAVDEWVNGLPFDANGALVTSVITDPNFANVSLLLHLDGSNGSTTFTDNSPSPKTATVSGNAQVSTSQFKYGGASAVFDGVDDAVSFPNSLDLQFLSGDFTIEFWFFASKAAQTQNFPRLLAKGNFSATGGWNVIYFKATGEVGFDIYTPATLFFSAGIASDNTWTHVAITRSGGTLRTFLNGVPGGSGANATNLNDASVVVLGNEPNFASDFNGYIDDVRLTKGVARYTSAFTPPSAAFPNS